ncbi:MAG: PL29 family lyase N-terminal domain-containing protein [Candidatus Cryptobacteroides sp.]
MKKFVRWMSSALAMLLIFGCNGLIDIPSEVDVAGELKDRIDQIESDVNDLKSRVAALEDSMKQQIEAVKTLLDGKVFVVGATQDETSKVWTIELSDGSSFKVYPEYVPEEVVIPAPIVTYVVEDGVYYWGYFNENGEAVLLLDAQGNKVPVVTEIPEVVIPEQKVPQIRVNPETNVIEISIDGETWYPTDVKMPEASQGGEVVVEPCQCVIADVWYNEAEGVIVFYGVDGNVVTEVPLMSEDNFNFGIKSGKIFLKPGASKTVELVVSGITDVSVLEKPDGWKAKVVEKKLTVTAPDSAAIASGIAEAEGYLKLHATTEDHKCIVSKLLLSASDFSLSISIDAEMNVVIEATETEEYRGFIYGVAAVGEFNPEDIVSYMEGEYLDFYSGEYSLTIPFSSFFNYYKPYVQGEEYVIYALPYYSADWWGWPTKDGLTAEDIIYINYCEKGISADFSDVTPFDAQLNLNVIGYDQYVVWAEKGYEGEFTSVEDIVSSITNPYFPTKLSPIDAVPYSGSASDYFAQVGESLEILPENSYMIALAPYKADNSYVVEDFVVASFKTTSLEAGGVATIAVTVDEPYSFSEVRFNVEASSDTYITYYRMYSDTQYAQLAGGEGEPSDDVLIEDIVHAMYGANMNKSTNFNDRKTSLNPGQKAYFAGLAISKDGKYGTLVKASGSTKEVAYNEAITVSIDEMGVCGPEDADHANNIKLVLSSTGGKVSSYRVYKNSASWSSKTIAEMESYMATASEYDYYCTNAVADADGKATVYLTNITLGQKYNIAVLAYDEDGNPTHAVGYNNSNEYVAELNFTLVRTTDDEYEAAAKPTVEVSAAKDPDWNSYDVTIKVTPAEGSVMTLGFWTYASSMSSKPAYDQVTAIIGATYNNLKATTEPVEIVKTAYSPDNQLFLTWIDANGVYYGPMVVDITDALVAAGWTE